MNTERMENMAVLLPRILPQVLPCPKSMAMDTLQMLAVDFCKETGVWTVTIQEDVAPCETLISLPIPKNAAISGIHSLRLDDRIIDGGGYEVSRRHIRLKDAAEQAFLATIDASLRPLRTSAELPEDILEEYGDILAFGAIAKIKAMSGQKVEWNDPAGMGVYYQLYQEGCIQARARKFRKRSGGGVRYVNTGEWE